MKFLDSQTLYSMLHVLKSTWKVEKFRIAAVCHINVLPFSCLVFSWLCVFRVRENRNMTKSNFGGI